MNNLGDLLKILLFSLFYAIFNVIGASVIKNELKKSNPSGWDDYFAFLFKFEVLLAFFAIFLSLLMVLKALSIGKFSIIAPITTGINFLLTLLVGYFYFKDSISWKHLLGIILIASGIVIISIAENQKQ